MPKQRVWFGRLVVGLAVMVPVAGGFAQAKTPTLSAPVATPATGVAPTEKELGATQEQLLTLLRMSPTLLGVVVNDPTMLSNQEYVSKNNPELGQFLLQHPEVGINPAFYLFSNLKAEGQHDYSIPKPKAGFEQQHEYRQNMSQEFLQEDLGPFVVMVCVFGALIWLIRLLLENRRWGKIFSLQSAVHGQLIEKFSSNQELLTYMETDAGKRFLEAAPIATEIDQKRLPNLVARVITTLQIGVVLALLGIGLLFLRHVLGHRAEMLLVLGVIVLMPGLGFMISAGITWVLAKRLGLIQEAQSERQ
jgi:hypothetical protein